MRKTLYVFLFLSSSLFPTVLTARNEVLSSTAPESVELGFLSRDLRREISFEKAKAAVWDTASLLAFGKTRECPSNHRTFRCTRCSLCLFWGRHEAYRI